jgi:hypothetical protein
MGSTTILSMLATVATASPAYAQRVELSELFGWTFSGGVEPESPVLGLDGNLYDAVDVKDSASWGFDIGFNATDNIQVGFLFGQQLRAPWRSRAPRRASWAISPSAPITPPWPSTRVRRTAGSART